MAIEIALAYILDLILGDPRWFPHPVKGIGWMISKLEPVLRKAFRSQRIGGMFLAVSVIGASWCLGFMIIKLAYSINRYLGSIISILIIYSSLAAKDLDVESAEVYHSLESKDIISARKKISLIVGRDTNNLELKEVVR